MSFHDHSSQPSDRPGPWRTIGLAIAAAACMAGCKTLPPPPLPTNDSLPVPLQVSASDILQETLDAHGQEHYVCSRNVAGLTWVDRGSEGTLVDGQSKSVGLVTSNNYFVANDDSYMYERVVAESRVEDGALTWQLARVADDPAKRTLPGRFGRISAVQRVRTSGGLPADTSCELDGASMYVPYSAVYLLYRSPADAAPSPQAKAQFDLQSAAVPRIPRAVPEAVAAERPKRAANRAVASAKARASAASGAGLQSAGEAIARSDDRTPAAGRPGDDEGFAPLPSR
jgi:hypothetical protein